MGICNGITTFIMSFYEYLLQHEYSVDFLLVTDKNLEMEPYVSEKGSKVFKVPNGGKYDKKRIAYINRVFKAEAYDIVHVNFPGPNGALVLKAAKKNGVKYRVYHCHNPLNNLSMKTRISEGIFTPLCRKRANKYVACSGAAGKSVFGDAKFEVIKNAIRPEDFLFDPDGRKQIREKSGIENRLVVGVAARMEEQKNPSFLIEVFSEFKKLQKDAVLLWVGDGSKMAQMRELCNEKNLQDAVLFVGRQSNVVEWYSAMDMFLLPSKFEGLGIVYLEAQANGLHCFGSDCVPEETEVTDRMHRISLEKSAAEWAEEMLRVTKGQSGLREVNLELFRVCGYDINYVENRLYEVYESYFHE
ncbi:MAG: glycosyltransferase family 1 protein [Lachnospiraceae bacterium]|nr:glycosyltransferase family 1 protein [Lachnospiraceae bacterium]